MNTENRSNAAAAEVRALRQRASNRCIVQEDAKRAPNLACSQTSKLDMAAKHDTVETDSVGFKVFKLSNDCSLDSSCSWSEPEKKEDQPWWQTTHANELASFSQKSLSHVENCDLPSPQKYLRRNPYDNINDDNIKTASFDCFDSDKSSSYPIPTTNKGVTQQVFKGDPSKAQLVEALCHSQKRAREAEEAAKQAYAEKEHIITLLFIQTSQLLAYKQLETLDNEIRNKDEPNSTLFPMAFFEGAKHGNRNHRFALPKEEIVGKTKSCVTTTYDVGVALGLSLVGTGLLLGWSVGWMLTNL